MAQGPTWTGHPLWLVGFRPFFPLAGLTASLVPLVWVLMLAGVIRPNTAVPIMQWHAHEMFFGFGLAVLGGFLLTATKNWVKVRGHHGRALQVLVATWFLERAALWWGAAWPKPLFFIVSNCFLVVLIGLLLWTLLRHRATDSYPDNFLFVLVLPLFLIAKLLLLDPAHFAVGRELTLSLFRMAFLVMLERTLVPFMKGAFDLKLARVFVIDTGIKALGFVLIAGPWLPGGLKSVLCVLLAALLLVRFACWHPHRALRHIELAVMYLGGAAIAAQLVLDAFPWSWVGTMSVHVFTFGAMGLIIPAMFIRIAKGHTGRPVVFDRVDKAVLWLMLIAFAARVVAPQLVPAEYPTWLWVAACCWSAGFALVTARLMPLVLRPRIDGKEH